MKTGWLPLMLTAVLALTACQHTASAPAGVRVLTEDGRVHQQIVSSEAVTELRTLWDKRRVAVVKMRPVFTYRVEFGTAATEQWLYAEAGFAVLASEPHGTIYVMAEREQINARLAISR